MKNVIRAVTQAEGLSPKTLQDSVVQELLLDGLPVTRRNYLRYAGLKEPLNTEVEADLPEQLQLPTDRDPGVKVVDIRIMKNGVRAIEITRTGGAIIILGMPGPSTSESQSSREVGDEPMRRLKNKVSDSNRPNVCPYCQQDLNAGVCEHWVASLFDDGGGSDRLTPLYFGWDQHWNDSQEDMIASLDWYFEGLCALCDQVAKKGPNERKRILREAKGLPPGEKATLKRAIKILDLPDAKENYETTHDLLRSEFGQPIMKDLFTDFFRRCGGKIRKTDILIGACYPGYPTWTGTHYWAEDAEKCVLSIIQERGKATDRINKLIYKR